MPLEFYCQNPECGGVAFQYTTTDMNPECKKRNWCHPRKGCCPWSAKKVKCSNWILYHSIHRTAEAMKPKSKQKSIHMSF